MKTIYKLDGIRNSKKALIEQFGADRINHLTKTAKEIFKEAPYITNYFFIGGFYRRLNIKFKF